MLKCTGFFVSECTECNEHFLIMTGACSCAQRDETLSAPPTPIQPASSFPHNSATPRTKPFVTPAQKNQTSKTISETTRPPIPFTLSHLKSIKQLIQYIYLNACHHCRHRHRPPRQPQRPESRNAVIWHLPSTLCPCPTTIGALNNTYNSCNRHSRRIMVTLTFIIT